MSPNVKIGLLALVGAASAVPHYGSHDGHSKFHSKSSGYAGPTGGWSNSNSTKPVPTGTGVGPVGGETTTIDSYSTSTSTVYSTVYLTKSLPSAGGSGSAPSSVGAAAASVSGAGSGAACGPATVYVTATNRVTVTVPAGGVASSSASKSTQYIYVSPSPVGSPSSATGAAVGTPSTIATPAKPTTPVAYSSAPVATPEQATTYATPTTHATPVTGASAPPSSYVAPSSPAAPSSYVAPSSAAPSSHAAPSSSAASSSAAPSSSGSPSYSGGKRGLVYRWDGAADAKTFSGKKFGFAWNWEADSKGDIGSLNFIPMLRTLANAGDWAEKVEAAISSGSKVVFGLNEPDIATQANLDVASLCSAWKQYMNPIKEKHPNVIVAGPAISSTDAEGKGLSYLQQFVSSCPDAKFDVINLHWYGPSSAGVSAFKSHVDTAIKQFGKNAWVTEFGLYAGESAEAAASFLKDALTYLDGNDKCDGYSYYAVGSFDPSANLLGNANALTDTGKVYVA